MQITATMVKELRERTGAGMMECKKALAESNGDMDAAIESMRKSGAAKAVKKAGRIAADGQVVIAIAPDHRRASIVEINCETDFVAKDDNFNAFAGQVVAKALAADANDIEALTTQALDSGETISATREALVAKIGENVQLRRVETLTAASGSFTAYRHGNRIGVLVELEGGDAALGKDIAMHIAASRPVCVDESQVPAELLEQEKEIFRAQAAESGKPADVIEKMITGRMKKYLAEVSLLGQPFVKDTDKTVAKLLQETGARVVRFVRYEVGEGIEKKQENFAEEVMAQARGH
ncbi:MAG: translation elongation factor Ts [Thiotrichales bacterium]